MTTKGELRQWFNRGKEQGATHMIVVCDTFDHEDYPVFVKPDEDVRERAKEYNGTNMQRIMEVYSMKLDIETQLAETRAFHWDDSSPAVRALDLATVKALSNDFTAALRTAANDAPGDNDVYRLALAAAVQLLQAELKAANDKADEGNRG